MEKRIMGKGETIEMEMPLMVAKVVKSKLGIYSLRVKAYNGSTNEWSFGMDEQIAKGRTATVLDAYAKGMEFIQEQVRTAFDEESKKQG